MALPGLLPAAPPALKGLVAFYFDRMDRWMEEAEQIGVHARDPYHRIDVIATDRHVRVLLDGQLLAETRQALALFETGLPARWYIPAEDVVAELQPSDTVTHCPYKGQGVLPLGPVARRPPGGGPDLVLRDPVARGGPDRRPPVLLQREG